MAHRKTDAILAEHVLHGGRDVGVFAVEDLRLRLDDSDLAAETAVRLCHFKPDIAGAQHHQVRRHMVELQRLDMGERPGVGETGNFRHCRMRPDVEHDLIAGKKARTAIVQPDFDRLGRREIPAAHDQLGTALPVGVEMEGHLVIDHGALALAYGRHVGFDRAVHRTVRRRHGAPDSRRARCRFRSCWACMPRPGTTRRPTAAPPQPSAGRVRPGARPAALPPCPLPRMTVSKTSG